MAQEARTVTEELSLEGITKVNFDTYYQKNYLARLDKVLRDYAFVSENIQKRFIWDKNVRYEGKTAIISRVDLLTEEEFQHILKRLYDERRSWVHLAGRAFDGNSLIIEYDFSSAKGLGEPSINMSIGLNSIRRNKVKWA